MTLNSANKGYAATRRALKLRPTQLRVQGAAWWTYPDCKAEDTAGEENAEPFGRYELNIQAGSKVPQEVVSLISEALLCPILTASCQMGRPAWDALVKSLDDAGFDLSSLTLTLDMNQPGPRPAWARKPRVPPQRAGVLDLRWGWVDYDHSPDMVCSWAVPCSRRESSLLLSWLSISRFDPALPLEKQPWQALMSQMEKMGIDLRTFHLVIRKKKAFEEKSLNAEEEKETPP